jgi:pimeloyl-ACP methyl ester carboxylesterase
VDDRDGELRAAQQALVDAYAPEAQVRSVRWSGGATQAYELGSGPPLLLIHGGGDAAYEWVPIMPALARRHRVLAVDRPGHGLADPFDYSGVDLRLHATTFLNDVLDALELASVRLLSNSIGGWWATVLALDRPDRVERVVVAGHPPGVTRHAPLPLRVLSLPAIGGLIGRQLLGKPTREGQRKFWGQVLVAHPERVADVLLDVDVAHTRRNRDSMLSLINAVVGPRGVRPQLLLGERWNQLAVPLLFLYGDADSFVSPPVAAAWRAIAERNARVRLSCVPNAGHLPWIDEPDAVVAELEVFLEEG